MKKPLSKQQFEWIFSKLMEFVVKWSENPPQSDKEWLSFEEAYRNLFKRSRDNAYMRELIITTINYIVSIAPDNRPALEMIE